MLRFSRKPRSWRRIQSRIQHRRVRRLKRSQERLLLSSFLLLLLFLSFLRKRKWGFAFWSGALRFVSDSRTLCLLRLGEKVNLLSGLEHKDSYPAFFVKAYIGKNYHLKSGNPTGLKLEVSQTRKTKRKTRNAKRRTRPVWGQICDQPNTSIINQGQNVLIFYPVFTFKDKYSATQINVLRFYPSFKFKDIYSATQIKVSAFVSARAEHPSYLK